MKIFVIYFLISVFKISGLNSRYLWEHIAEWGEFPYQASLQYGVGFLRNHVCGAVIIGPKWVLSAGHCINKDLMIPFAYYYVVAGIYTLLIGNGKVARVKTAYIHPHYMGGVGPNDISLLELENEFVFDEFIQPISLPEANEIPTGKAILSGWGFIDMDSVISIIIPLRLHALEVPILNNGVCKLKMIQVMGKISPMEHTNLCTGAANSYNEGACPGDSGGPLISVNENGNITLIGIISWGVESCFAPTIYTRVSAYINFINQIIHYSIQ